MRSKGRFTIFLFVVMISGIVPKAPTAVGAQQRPNILWITNEDISPDLGCYGVRYANTPRLDRLASEGVLYSHAFATSGVCAPARSCIIMGVYPTSIGSQHMRSQGDRPAWMHQFPYYLRKAGYYTTNNVKTDYNMPVEPETWDENSRQAHYAHRADGQPFFAVFNFTMTHESALHQYDGVTHDPREMRVPKYHPDTPEVRRDWARYNDRISEFDEQVGRLLDELEEKNLADDTIVFYFSDHGAGMPRGKRWLYDSGTRVPLIIRFGDNFRYLAPLSSGSRTDRLVSFVDFAATVLSLAGVPVPEHMQGRPFLGQQAVAPRQYVYGLRGRMDERYDMQRSVRDQRYKYIRNYMPHKTYALHLEYMYRTATMKTWQRLHDSEKLNTAQDFFFTDRRPVEELYDTVEDPDEVNNLAGEPEYIEILHRLRGEHRRWMLRTRDVGLLPEPEIHARPQREGYRNAYEWAQFRFSPYRVERILQAAWVIGDGRRGVQRLVTNLGDDDPAVRFWAALHLNGLAPELPEKAKSALWKALEDPDPSVQVQAAQALAKEGNNPRAVHHLAELLEHQDQYVALAAAIALDELDQKAAAERPAMEKALERGNYIARVAEFALSDQTEKSD